MRVNLSRLAMIAATTMAGAVSLAHADDSSSLEERMSYKDFRAYGLDKLTPEQLQGLNQWLTAHGGACPAAAVAPASGAAAAVGVSTAVHDQRIHSRIVGDFTGWEKGTVLTLANGQKWEVRDDEPLISDREEGVEVTIEPGMLGGWTLSVDGHNAIAHVIPAN